MKGMDVRGVQWERGDMVLEGMQGWNTNKAIYLSYFGKIEKLEFRR